MSNSETESTCKLTADLIEARSRCSRLESLKVLNCWGCNLTDITILEELPAIRVIILTSNYISKLHPISQCRKLRELYLRNNKIEDLEELHTLSELKNLRSLWISDNPCTSMETYLYAKNIQAILPRLKYLDGQPIELYLEQKTETEKMEESNVFKAVSILMRDLSSKELIEVQRLISLQLSNQ